jgi:hypothetical protein
VGLKGHEGPPANVVCAVLIVSRADEIEEALLTFRQLS